MYTSYLGSETGTALAEVITGSINPSGKLPYSLPARLEDSPAHALGEYPGSNGKVEYKEDLFVGYRYYDSKNVKPLFPFGFGLSYTTFAYSDYKIDLKGSGESLTCTVSFKVTNTGKVQGKESAQVYVRDPESAFVRPFKELKGFAKVDLKPGETKSMSIVLNQRAFQYYNPDTKQWVAEAGKYEMLVGTSSDNIVLKQQFDL